MKKTSILLLIAVLLLSTVVSAESYTIDKLNKGDTLRLKSEFTGVPTYPEDILEYLGYNEGHQEFKALKDLENIKADFNFEVIEEDAKVEEGSANDNGEVGSGTGGQATWEGLEMGKQQWASIDGLSNRYAIRLQADKFDRENEITVIDLPNKKLNIKGDVDVVGYRANGNYINTSDVVKIESKIEMDDKGFTIKFMPNKEVAAYDVVYNTQRDTELINKYVALQKGDQVVGNGTITGEVKPEDTCPVCPTCPDNEDKIKELEDKIKEKDKIIEELENREPEIKEVIVEKEVIVKEIEEVVKEVIKEKPIYITEVQIKEIIKEVEKEVEVEKPVYITEVKEVVREVIKEVPAKENIPEASSGKTLPATGEGSVLRFIIAGAAIALVGIVLRRNA